MERNVYLSHLLLTSCVAVALLAGCRSSSVTHTSIETSIPVTINKSDDPVVSGSSIQLASSETEEHVTPEAQNSEVDAIPPPPPEANQSNPDSDLVMLIRSAEVNNPKLQRLNQETSSAWAKARHVDTLPDPVLGFNIFGNSIETAAGSQRANLSLMQMIPWLSRLNAQAQQACFDAMALQQVYQIERLTIVAEIESQWAKLYLLNQQQRILNSNQELLKSLIDLVNARISLNQGSVGDVTLMTVEIGRVEEQLVITRQQIRSTAAELNRLAGRPANSPVALPKSVPSGSKDWSHLELTSVAYQHQPEIAAAQLRMSAARWGIEVAELKRRPDISLGASWFAIDNNRPASTNVDVGQDAWSIGAQISIPFRESKYDAMRNEATWKFHATVSSMTELKQKYDARLLDLNQKKQAAAETASLYRDSIIPQAEQTLKSDQQALANGSVDLDRVIQDVRTLLTLELGYHRALSKLAIAEAQIGQAVGGKKRLP